MSFDLKLLSVEYNDALHVMDTSTKKCVSCDSLTYIALSQRYTRHQLGKATVNAHINTVCGESTKVREITQFLAVLLGNKVINLANSIHKIKYQTIYYLQWASV